MWCTEQGELPFEGGGHGLRRGGEGGVDGVPHRLEHRPPVTLDSSSQEIVVPAHRLAVGDGVGLEQPGAALQVGKQEGDRPLRQRHRRRRGR
jgi:hypothetical protein